MKRLMKTFGLDMVLMGSALALYVYFGLTVAVVVALPLYVLFAYMTVKGYIR